MTESIFLRRLEGAERLAAITNTFYPGGFNLIAMFEMEGDVTQELLQTALEKMQQQFECLNVAIVFEPGSLYQWVFKRIHEVVKLEIIHSTQPDQYLKVWDELSSTHIQGLAWRAAWVRQSNRDKSHFFVLFHHAILDGASLGYFFLIFLKTIQSLLDGKVDKSIIQSIPPAAHRLIKARWPIIPILRMGYHRYLRRLRMINFDAKGNFISTRRWQVIFRTIEAGNLSYLIQRCREQSLTLTHAFSAASILEVASRIREYESKAFDLALCRTVDLRRGINAQTTPPLLGALFSAVFAYFRPHPTDTLWKIAKQAAYQYHRALRWCEDRDFSLIQSLMGPKLIAAQARINQGRAPEGAIAVTNIGRFHQGDLDQFRITAVYATPVQAVWGCTLFLGFVSIENQLFISFGYPSPSIAKTIAESILDGMINRLLFC